MKTLMLAAQLLQEAVANGGSTLSRGGKRPTKGYAVGGAVMSQLLVRQDRTAESVGVVAAFIDATMARTFYYGSWTHNGHVYIDAVTVFMDRTIALECAAQRKEIAIYDIERGEEITL